jgi:alcohol dehydrogenase class IV
MVGSFQFTPTPKLIFGVGKRRELPGLIRSFGLHTLIITGAGSFTKSVTGSQLLKEIEGTGEFCHFVTVSGEPTPEIIDKIVGKYRHVPLDVVVAIGGGSVLDAGKAISAMIRKSETILEYLEGVGTKQPDGSKLPFIAMPTTAGTGSETTKNAVISKIGANGFKKSLRHDNYIPNIALVDPELTLSCSKEITASSGTDAFTQLLEAYVSPRSSTFIDLFTFEGIRLAVKYLLEAWRNGDNLEARTGMAYAAMLSGMALANSGLGTVHGFASSVGGFYPIPHGVICGTLMAECAAKNIEKLSKDNNSEAYMKYAAVGRLFTENQIQNDQYYCQLLVDSLRNWIEEMKISRLSSFGVKSENLEEIAKVTDNKNNPVALSTEEMMEILETRL